MIKVLKQAYRKKLVQRYVRDLDACISGESQNEKKVSLNILDSMHYISTAWNDMKPEVIRNCFRRAHIGEGGEEALPDEDATEYADFTEYLTIDDGIVTAELRTIEQLVDDRDQNPEEETEDEEEEARPIPSAGAALNSLSAVRDFVSSIPESQEMLSLIGKVENFIVNEGVAQKKQTRIDSFLQA